MTRIDPGIPNMVVLTGDRAYRDKDGDWRVENDLVVPPEVVEQFRQGYRCMECLAVQSTAFPDVCEEVYKDGGGCGYRIRTEQPARFARDFGGDTELWPELERDVERERYEARGIALPPWYGR